MLNQTPIQTPVTRRLRTAPSAQLRSLNRRTGGAQQIELWQVDLALGMAQMAAHWRTLSDDEQAKAKSIERESDRNLFVLARSSLRRVLAEALQIDPSDIRLMADEQGRPMVEQPLTSLQFSTSYRATRIVHALAPQAPVGIDIEPVDASFLDTDPMLNGPRWQQWLASAELQRLRELSDDARPAALAQAWVRKQAYLKATGRISHTRAKNTTLALNSHGRVVVRGEGADATAPACQIIDLDQGPEFAGALACLASSIDLRQHRPSM